MATAPSASDITVRQVLAKFEGDFASVADAVSKGEFAFWLGSGISQRAPKLGDLIKRALEYLRFRAVDPVTGAQFRPAFEDALRLADVDPSTRTHEFGQPIAAWSGIDAIVDVLWNRYSRVLDLTVPNEAPDFILWDAVDIRDAFSAPPPPSAEHLCIAILVLEGAIRAIASANWDGFVESAVDRLSGATPQTLQVVVDPNDLREAPGRATLYKFHGCIVYATSEPAVFRRYLIGSQAQIINWPHDLAFAAMRNAVTQLATHQKTMVLGLSIQDANLQGVFAAARAINPWSFPCVPEAPGHVFCEDTIRQGQQDVLKVVYGASYNANTAAIHAATHLRSWAEQVLIALVLKLTTDKLVQFMRLSLASLGKGAYAPALSVLIADLRDMVADNATSDGTVNSRTDAVNAGIASWSRLLSIFRRGSLQPNPLAYEATSITSVNLIATDPNALASGLDRLAVTLALLQHGQAIGSWALSLPAAASLRAGSVGIRASRPGAPERPLLIVKSATEAVALKAAGAFDDHPIVIHGDSVWAKLGGSPRRKRSPPGRTGRRVTTHVSIEKLLVQSSDVPSLYTQFVADMTA